MHDNYWTKRKDYRFALRNFLNHREVDRVRKLCVAAETDEKLFWKLLKGQRSSSQMSAFLVNGAFITEENDIRDMWEDHFEVLGTPTVSLNFDNEFANSISTHIQNIFQNCINDPTGALNEPLTYEEVAGVCSSLKPGVSGVSLDYVVGWLKNHVTVKPFLMNVLFPTTLPTLKACNSPYMQYYFKRFFVLHSSEVTFSFLIKKSRQKAIEIEIAFFHSLGNPRGHTHWIISFMLCISVITSSTN